MSSLTISLVAWFSAGLLGGLMTVLALELSRRRREVLRHHSLILELCIMLLLSSFGVVMLLIGISVLLGEGTERRLEAIRRAEDEL